MRGVEKYTRDEGEKEEEEQEDGKRQQSWTGERIKIRSPDNNAPGDVDEIKI